MKQGSTISPGGVSSTWFRDTLETSNKHLKAPGTQDGGILTEAQLVALEKAKAQREAGGEIEADNSEMAFVKLYDRKSGLAADGIS